MQRMSVFTKLLAGFCLLPATIAFAAALPAKSPLKLLTADEVTQNMVHMNMQRAQALQTYESTRTYRLQYHGFPGSRSAEMVVLVKYTAPGNKEFTIQSATGSKLIIDKVFKKLLESEKEASGVEIQARTALSPVNYVFTMLDYVEGTGPERPMYVLSVEPRVPSKFLYRGKIWIDAGDFAVVRIEAEPAKSPSFWTKSTTIKHEYLKVQDFWLPASNHSVSEIRLGGEADLTIDYHDYRITSSIPLAGSSLAQSAR